MVIVSVKRPRRLLRIESVITLFVVEFEKLKLKYWSILLFKRGYSQTTGATCAQSQRERVSIWNSLVMSSLHYKSEMW